MDHLMTEIQKYGEEQNVEADSIDLRGEQASEIERGRN